MNIIRELRLALENILVGGNELKQQSLDDATIRIEAIVEFLEKSYSNDSVIDKLKSIKKNIEDTLNVAVYQQAIERKKIHDKTFGEKTNEEN